MMQKRYEISDDRLLTPVLAVDPEIVAANIDRMVQIVGGRHDRLWPHMKTHKTREVLDMLAARGIRRTKCSTLAEVELAAMAGVHEILLARQPSQQDLHWLTEFARLVPEARFSFVCDNLQHFESLLQSSPPEADSTTPGVFIDIDTGMGRTGISPGEAASRLAEAIVRQNRFAFRGLHVYDGHISNGDYQERKEAFLTAIGPLKQWISDLETMGIVPEYVVAGGSPTFQCVAECTDWHCSPGTTVFWDAGFGSRFMSYPFEPAIRLLCRVISLQDEGKVCLDLGHKAVSAENPIEKRVFFPGFPEMKFLKQNEEHLLVDPGTAHQLRIGDILEGIPWHVCPTVALYNHLRILDQRGVPVDQWDVVARRRIG